MRSFAIFLGLILLGFAGLGLLAYPAWLLISQFPGVDPKFSRVASRVGMLVLLLGFIVVARRLKVADRQSLGYGLRAGAFAREVGIGMLVGPALMLPVLAMMILLDMRVLQPEALAGAATWIRILLTGVFTGLVVAFIEETFFRGAMQTAMTRESGLAPAILLPSVVYAALHFVAGKYRIPASEIDYGSGFHMLAEFLRKFSDPLDILDAFLCLTGVGVLLGLVRAVTGNIAASIGLHAGWVAVILVVRQTSLPNSQSSLAWMIDDHDGFIGWLVLAWTPLMGWILYRWYRKRGAVTSPAAPG